MTSKAQEQDQHHIGTLQESSLHAALKAYYREPSDRVETVVDGYVIDIVREDLLIEIQTANFSAIKTKLRKLVKHHRLKLVYPIAREKWIVRVEADGSIVSRRKSPKKGRIEDLFYELIRIPHIITDPNFALEVAFTQQEEYWVNDGKGSWRRKRWSIGDRKLLQVVNTVEFTEPADFLNIVPEELERPFTNRQLKETLKVNKRHAGKITYCLQKMGLIEVVGKQGNAYLFSETNQNRRSEGRV